MTMNNGIHIDGSLEITLEWSDENTDKNAFLYLVAFKLTNGEITELRDIIFRDTNKEDGVEYSGVKKRMISSSGHLTQKLKLDTKGIRNAITDIIFFMFSFKADNLAKGRLSLNCSEDKRSVEYKLSDSLHLCIEFGRMKRCSSYWELYLDSMEYKNIETPYRIFASKNLKNNYSTIDIFNLNKKIEMLEDKDTRSIMPVEERKSEEKKDGDYQKGYVPPKANRKKRSHSHSTMPTQKNDASSRSTKNKNDESAVPQEVTASETTSVKTIEAEDKKSIKTNKRTWTRGIMPYKNKNCNN